MPALNPAFIFAIAIGLIFLIAGYIQGKFPPKKINYFYGYRTKRSMASQESWDFAQGFAARAMQKFGLLLMVLSLVGAMVPIPLSFAIPASVILIVLACLMLFMQTEKALKARF